VTTATATSGSPIHYNDGYYYDGILYYDKWYSVGGTINQGESPKLTIKDTWVTFKPKLTNTAVTTGFPIHYDEGYYYDGLIYYSKWYSVDGTVNQGEIPRFSVKND
jgi:hypothetical protein